METQRTKAHFTLEDWKQTWMNRIGDNTIFISALNRENLKEFRKKLYGAVRKIHITRFPYNNFLYPEYIEE